MKAENAERAAILVAALRELKPKRAIPPKRGDVDVGLAIDVGAIEHSGGNRIVQPDFIAAVVDHHTGLRILDAAAEIVREELKKLGVKP